MYAHITISPPSCISLPPSLSHPSRWSQSTELVSLCYVVDSHEQSILRLVVYICQCYSLTSSQLTLPPPCVLKSILYVCIFFFFKHLYWSIIALQWCVSFCFVIKWIGYTYTYIPISPPSCISRPPSLSHPSRWSQSTELISLCCAAASH